MSELRSWVDSTAWQHTVSVETGTRFGGHSLRGRGAANQWPFSGVPNPEEGPLPLVAAQNARQWKTASCGRGSERSPAADRSLWPRLRTAPRTLTLRQAVGYPPGTVRHASQPCEASATTEIFIVVGGTALQASCGAPLGQRCDCCPSADVRVDGQLQDAHAVHINVSRRADRARMN
jgi:hypothetical protein